MAHCIALLVSYQSSVSSICISLAVYSCLRVRIITVRPKTLEEQAYLAEILPTYGPRIKISPEDMDVTYVDTARRDAVEEERDVGDRERDIGGGDRDVEDEERDIEDEERDVEEEEPYIDEEERDFEDEDRDIEEQDREVEEEERNIEIEERVIGEIDVVGGWSLEQMHQVRLEMFENRFAYCDGMKGMPPLDIGWYSHQQLNEGAACFVW